MIDVCILSDAKTDYHKTITSNCIDTLLKSERDGMFNIYLNESNDSFRQYIGNNVYNINEPFNYNRFMNLLAKEGTSPYIAFCNNDLTFEPEWATRILDAMNTLKLDSASPYCKITHHMQRISPTGLVRLGWNVRLEFTGWCFVIRREAWEKIGGLDEDFSFWCADNATVEQLKAAGMKHGLVTNSFVTHIGGQTLATVDNATKEQITFVQVKKFNNKYDQNVWGMGK